MGTWGTALYSNDTACDIRGDYKDALRRGRTNEEITAAMIEENRDCFGTEDEALFWFALADTQWNYGRLLPEIKEKALYFIDNEIDDRWEQKKDIVAWNNTLAKLKAKLLSDQPPEKKVSRYRSYRCEWALGDVYAYQLNSDYSKEAGYFNQYVAFRKVSECRSWPDDIIPIVKIYKWIGDALPTLEQLADCVYLETCIYPPTLENIAHIEYKLKLYNNKKSVIPYEHLTYLGNIPGDDLIPYRGPKRFYSYHELQWKQRVPIRFFEYYFITQYEKWCEKDIVSFLPEDTGYIKHYAVECLEDRRAYVRLLPFLYNGYISDAFSLVYPEGGETNPEGSEIQSIREQLAPYKIASKRVTSWPGTQLSDDEQDQVFVMETYKADIVGTGPVIQSVDSLWGWNAPSRPMDLCFYKKGRVVFESSARSRTNRIYQEEIAYPPVSDLEKYSGIKLIPLGETPRDQLFFNDYPNQSDD